MVSGLGRPAGDGTGSGIGKGVVAGFIDGTEPGARTWIGTDLVEFDAKRDPAAAESRPAAGAVGPAFVEDDAGAFPEEKPAAVEGAVVRGSTGHAQYQGDQFDWRAGLGQRYSPARGSARITAQPSIPADGQTTASRPRAVRRAGTNPRPRRQVPRTARRPASPAHSSKAAPTSPA